MKTLVLAHEATAEALSRLAERAGWTPHGDVQRTHTRFRAITWTSENGEIRWYEHHGLGVRAVSAPGPDAATIAAELPTLDPAALAGQAASADPILAMQGLNALLVAGADAAFLTALAAHAVHPNVWVRRNARYCVQYTALPGAAEAIRPALNDEALGPLWKAQLDRLESAQDGAQRD